MLDALLCSSSAVAAWADAAADVAGSGLPWYSSALQAIGRSVDWVGSGFSDVLWSASWSSKFFRGNDFKDAVYGLQIFLTLFGAALLVAGKRGWWIVVTAGLTIGGGGLLADAVNRVGVGTELPANPTSGAAAHAMQMTVAGVIAAVIAVAGAVALAFRPKARGRTTTGLALVGSSLLVISYRGPIDIFVGTGALAVTIAVLGLRGRTTSDSQRAVGFWQTMIVGLIVIVVAIAASFAVAAFGSWWYGEAGKFISAGVAVVGLTVLALGLFGAALLVLAKRGTMAPKQLMMPMWIVMGLLACGTYYNFGNPHVRYSGYYHRHEFFHYYVGSKYFTELGYKHIYECSAVAEMDDGKLGDPKTREIRDLRDNLIKPIADTKVVSDPDGLCRDRFGDRWDEFKSDVAWFRKSAHGGDYWKNMWKDHGYNPPPVWTMGGKALGSLTPANGNAFLALSMIDVWLQLMAILLMFWAFGWRVGAIAAVFWGCNAPADFYWTGGAFIRQDWYFLLVASVCFARKRMYALSGAALMWCALLRLFPVALFAGWGFIILFDVARRIIIKIAAFIRRPPVERGGQLVPDEHREVPTAPPDASIGGAEMVWREIKSVVKSVWRFIKDVIRAPYRWLIFGCAVAFVALGVSSAFVAGADAYPRFLDHIETHKGTPLTNHMGLPTILSHRWEGRMMVARNDTLDDPFEEWKTGRTQRTEDLKWLQYSIVGLMLVWMAWCLRRTKLLWVGLPLGLGLIPGLTNLTCYYFCMYIIAAALAAKRPAVGAALLILSGASQIMHHSYHFYDDRFTADSWLFIVFSFVLLFAYSRPFSFSRLWRWLTGKPEKPPSLGKSKDGGGGGRADAPSAA